MPAVYIIGIRSVPQLKPRPNDLVTLVLGLPLLAISFWLTLRDSLRGRLLLTGTLGFILYTYISMCFGAAYNRLFLVYVALFGLSLYAFILSMMSFDLKTLPAHFSAKLPRRWIAGLLFFAAAFLAFASSCNRLASEFCNVASACSSADS